MYNLPHVHVKVRDTECNQIPVKINYDQLYLGLTGDDLSLAF